MERNLLSQSPRRIAAATALTLSALPLGSAWAEAETMGVIESSPRPHEVVHGSMVPITLRFNAPVDHARSTVSLKSDRGVRMLVPRLNGAPNYLYSSAGRLMPGAYELAWKARAADGRIDSGAIPFTVE